MCGACSPTARSAESAEASRSLVSSMTRSNGRASSSVEAAVEVARLGDVDAAAPLERHELLHQLTVALLVLDQQHFGRGLHGYRPGVGMGGAGGSAIGSRPPGEAASASAPSVNANRLGRGHRDLRGREARGAGADRLLPCRGKTHAIAAGRLHDPETGRVTGASDAGLPGRTVRLLGREDSDCTRGCRGGAALAVGPGPQRPHAAGRARRRDRRRVDRGSRGRAPGKLRSSGRCRTARSRRESGRCRGPRRSADRRPPEPAGRSRPSGAGRGRGSASRRP